MLRSELATQGASAAFASEMQRIALPLGQAGGNFSALMSQVQREVGDFIAHGASESGFPARTADGSTQLARLRAGDAANATDDAAGELSPAQQAFVASLEPGLGAAAQRLGVSPNILAAHAALESGWGQRPLRHADGADTHNLFGIKAGGGWQGASAEVTTTEFEGDLALKKRERFRSYADAGQAFQDFTRLLLDNPRYQTALNTGNDVRAYAQGLVRGGFATDPAYADKLARVASRLQSGD